MWGRGENSRKGAMNLEEMGGWIVILVLLVVLVIGIVIAKSKGEGAIAFLKNLFRFGVG